MAKNSRTLTGSLTEGATDGKYRKVRPNTTVNNPALGDDLTRANRATLHPFWNYGFTDTEAVKKVSPLHVGDTPGRVPSLAGTPVFDIDAYTAGQEH